MSANKEVWQVMVDGQVYETDLDGLREWVAEGCFHVTDKVRKGSLNWIDAGKVPMLRRLFTGEDAANLPPASAPAPVSSAAPAAANVNAYQPAAPAGSWGAPAPQNFGPQSPGPGPTPGFNSFNPSATNPGGQGFVAPMPPVPAGHRPMAACINHPNLAPKMMCKNCANTFCDSCVKYVNGRIPLCPLCGELCDLFEKVKQRAVRDHYRHSGFGFEDFGTALAYPFKHPVSLIAGAAIYGLLLIAGFFGNLAAYMLLFGCMTTAIRQVAWGRLDRCFIDDDDFSFWDDMIHPAILGIGITIITWGPTIVLAIVLVFTIATGVQSAKEQGLSGNYPESSETSPISEQDRADLESGDPQRSERAARQVGASSQPNRRGQEAEEMMNWLLAISLPILGLMVVTVLWGFFYYPMALSVAGFTQQFSCVINPMVGLDTIKRMGSTYFKAFLMYLAVALVGGVITVIIWVITSPFEMPLIGNLPGKVMNGVVTFYTSLVISFILGLSLYKSSDKLDIQTD